MLAICFGLTLAGSATWQNTVVDRRTPTGPSGRIVYVRHGAIFLTSVDGRTTRQLTRIRGSIRDLAVSPDGRRIAFDMRVAGTVGKIAFYRSEIWTFDTTTSASGRVTRGGSDTEPAWSNDGRRIMFSHLVFDRAGGWAVAIFSVRPDASRRRRMTSPRIPSDDGVCDMNPLAWPGRAAFLFERASSCTHGFPPTIEARTTAGREIPILDRLGEKFESVDSLDVAPTGRRVVFVASPVGSDDSAEGIYVSRPDGSAARRLTVDGYSPSWSPDGGWIAFARSGDIWIMRSDGSEPRRVTRSPQTEDAPDWLP